MGPPAGDDDGRPSTLHPRGLAAKKWLENASETDDSHDGAPTPRDDALRPQQVKYVCNLNIHDGVSWKDDILVDMRVFAADAVAAGDLMHVRGIKGSAHKQYACGAQSEEVNRSALHLDQRDLDSSNPHLFRVKPMPSDMISKHPDLEFSVSSQIATAFHLVKGSQVILTSAERSACSASHVEIIFRDQYLARADMWRLVNSELADQCLHKGQRIVYLGNIKATINSIFVHGRKTHSACFTPSTKPIFRSESARYVLFIQMSKEMWDFDAEGTGEIMFDKVINGFLPELFRRWQDLQAKHLLSIILFTRMLYDEPLTAKEDPAIALGDLSMSETAVSTSTKDFYRVVVSDMPSGESANILTQLKQEFKVFLRDISIRKPEAGDFVPLGSSLSVAPSDLPNEVVAGHPSTAAHGNVLEAINLASSQFSSDYIDRDLVRTGVSIIVVSPGTGLFEVDYDLLAATTDNLIDNGVGIDLVCLSRMPLHSVPLFQYKQPHQEAKARQKQKGKYALPITQSYQTPSPSSFSPGSYQNSSTMFRNWSFGIPHWVDVSFWTSREEDRQQAQKKIPKSRTKPEELSGSRYKPFIPRVKMYELQMMGVMDNAEREISIPQLILGESSASSKRSQAPLHLGMAEPKRLQEISSDLLDNVTDRPSAANAMLSTSPRSMYSKGTSNGNALIQKMDDYDDLLFRSPRASRRRKAQRRVKQRLQKDIPSSSRPANTVLRKSSLSIKPNASEDAHGAAGAAGRHTRQTSAASVVTSSTEGGGTLRKGTRSISFGLRGLTPKAIATASAQVDVAQSPAWSTKSANKSNVTKPEPAHSLSSLSVRQASAAAGPRSSSDREFHQVQPSDSDRQDSQPIPIRNTTSPLVQGAATAQNPVHRSDRQPEVRDRIAALSDVRDAEASIEHEEAVQPLPTVLSPSTTLAPWLTILNPCNPSKTKLAETMRLGRWQHVYPRAPKTSQMKWKSLCSPAAVPLTTEEFPTADELEEEYRRESYVITLPEEMDLSKRPQALVHELLAFRLSRGFQIVVGDRLAEVEPSAARHTDNVFCEKILGDVQSTVFLSRGSAIHHLTRSSLDRLEVEVFTRHSVAAHDKKREEKPVAYTPLIRSMLGSRFLLQSISITPQRGSFNWDMIDAFIAGHERPEAARYVETLRPWRARFVLMPIDPPSSIRRSVRPSEDNEEEIRLEGIRKLTQMWQRFRFIPHEKRGYQPHGRTSKDPNPLDISYQTKDPSAVIAAELESVLEGDETGRPVQLLPEPDLYQRSNLDLKTLAETLQGEKGVRMLDRRWHWRLHYNCFIGFELTTWLLQNFRDVETRDEAEELGKRLMKDGLFKHVEQRHDFRDGNYFYQMEAEYRAPRPESKGWFGRGKSSVPPTPMTEKPPPELPRTTRSRASSNADTASDLDSTTRGEKKQQLSVALSKSLLYDVDHRQRSYRQELINLHYDRLHNPDNCYHIRVEWMNTTPRLVQEAVVSWATAVDRFGLRLIEVPIGEASSITSMHPFRAPLTVVLAQPPPTQQPHDYFDATAFVPQPQSDPIFYHKAILKHFNFVLDFEAASSFPADVEVSYSWGKPDFRYPQYIHRSGVLIAQITDEGHFLLLANRLYNDRSAGANSLHREARVPPSSDNRSGTSRSAPHTAAHRSSPHASPYPSPAVRATTTNLEIPSPPTQPRSSGPSPTPNPAQNPSPADHNPSPTAENLTKAIQAFCSSPPLLEAFYTAVLSQTATPSSTPFVTKTPLMTPLRKFTEGVREEEGEIPGLDLQGSPTTATMAASRREERERLKARMREVEIRRAIREGLGGDNDGSEGG